VVADYHVHTPYCGHAHGTIIRYIEHAVEAGMAEIGFTDHLGRYYLGRSQRKRYWDWGMKERDVARYVSELLDLKESFEDDIIVRLGLEIDYIEGAEQLVERIVSQYPFDYLLGSVHCLPTIGWRHITQYVKEDPARLFAEYFASIKAAAGSGLFQCLAHLDFIWRYVDWADAPQETIHDYISDAVASAHTHGTAVEVNANGYVWSQLRTGGADFFDMFLALVKKYNAKITIGSDAHSPELVGKAFPEIIALLKAKGITSVSQFDQKHQKQVHLG
jgi:histidinol-phosphatase (PHP family)